MGTTQSSEDALDDEELRFDDFQILRNIGKGSFSKVCIVQKRDSKSMYAMKYMSKAMCMQKDAFRNVVREVDILSELNHPFLVNLWFSFQDDDDMFLVFDLLLGGDLRYHLGQRGPLPLEQVRLYLCEIALALDYLQKKCIVHRDVKPDNILLDDAGHAHLTDFNIATILNDSSLATSASGTRPYMAPEIFLCAMRSCPGYSFPVDWWSLGVVCYELLTGYRPYDIRSDDSPQHCMEVIKTRKYYIPDDLDQDFLDLIAHLLNRDQYRRYTSLNELQRHRLLTEMDFKQVLRKKISPVFVPPKETLNCDPTFELEEMIIETNPLYKKKRKLKSGRKESKSLSGDKEEKQETPRSSTYTFKVYNREKLLKDEEARVRRLEEELGLRPPPQENAIAKRLGSVDTSANQQ